MDFIWPDGGGGMGRHPGCCPVCQTPPYPALSPCEECGFEGAAPYMTWLDRRFGYGVTYRLFVVIIVLIVVFLIGLAIYEAET